MNAERRASLKRAGELKKIIADYRRSQKEVVTGFSRWPASMQNQERIKKYFRATDQDWADWRWQLRNRIHSTAVLKELLKQTTEETREIDRTATRYRWAVSPYYLSLIDPSDPADPIRRQAVPSIFEYMDTCGETDPMDEAHTSPAPAVTRRYPDRLIINVTNRCATYCRHCQRRRNIGEKDLATPKRQIGEALNYIRKNKEIRDVLLTGGDGFMLSNQNIAWLLDQLDQIPHVEIKRIGTRTPVTLPQRIDDELCAILSKRLPLFVNTQFNHPLEVTPAAREACFKLARAGVALGNQAVLLKGINNDAYIMRKLNQELLKIMIRPYYLFHAKLVRGTSHFLTRVEEGLEIMEKLRGFTSGMAIPTYILNAPRGYGKTPLLPTYLVGIGKDYLTIRTWENRLLRVANKEGKEIDL